MTVHGGHPVVVYVPNLIVVSAAAWRCIHKAITCSRCRVTLCIDGCVVDLGIRAVLTPGALEVEAGIVNLLACLPG